METPNWSNLNHAYGPADDIPRLLENLTPDVNAEIWDELWSRLYHQGTVYSASFAAIPRLLDFSRQWSPKGRTQPLCLAGAIVGADELVGSREAFIESVSWALPELYELTIETLPAVELTRTDRLYLLGAALAFRGCNKWEGRMDSLANGEFDGTCPNCGTDLYLVIGEYGFFATAREWIKNPEVHRVPITPASAESLPEVGAWLCGLAADSGETELSDWIRYLFGSTTCPGCNGELRISEVI